MHLPMALAMAGVEATSFGSEFGPSAWTLQNWKGVGFAAAAFFVLLYMFLRAAKPSARRMPASEYSRTDEERENESE